MGTQLRTVMLLAVAMLGMPSANPAPPRRRRRTPSSRRRGAPPRRSRRLARDGAQQPDPALPAQLPRRSVGVLPQHFERFTGRATSLLMVDLPHPEEPPSALLARSTSCALRPRARPPPRPDRPDGPPAAPRAEPVLGRALSLAAAHSSAPFGDHVGRGVRTLG